MTILAQRGLEIAGPAQSAMDRLVVAFVVDVFRSTDRIAGEMTPLAVDLLQAFAMGNLGDVGMAIDTLPFGMNRFFQLLGIHVEGQSNAAVGHDAEILPLVTDPTLTNIGRLGPGLRLGGLGCGPRLGRGPDHRHQ